MTKKIILNDIDFNLLLNRSNIEIDNVNNKFFINKNIFISGGCGSIGSEIVRQLIKINITNIIIYDNDECSLFELKNEIRQKFNVGSSTHNIHFILGSILNKNKLETIFKKYNIQIVFHCAAYKHVPILEYNFDEAINNNIIGTQNLVDLSLKYIIEDFIFISTDKAINPTSIMGVSKRICELYINFVNNNNNINKTNFITTRFGNVIGSSGSVITVFLNKINNNQNLIVTHKDITRYFMTIPEAAQLVLHSSIIGDDSDIFIFEMGEQIKIITLAERMIELYGNNDTKITITDLRPGEKLYEELSYKEEVLINTGYKNLKRLKHKNIDYNNFYILYNDLINFKYNDLYELKNLLKKIVPEYTG